MLLLAFGPDYTERMIGDIFEDPVGPFLYGIMVPLFLLVVIVLLVIPLVIGALGFGTVLEDRYT